VEEAPVAQIFAEPRHPYTQGLLQAIPRLGDRSSQKLNVIPGTVPSPAHFPAGCRFHPRCSQRFEPCASTPCEITPIGADHAIRCHLANPENIPR